MRKALPIPFRRLFKGNKKCLSGTLLEKGVSRSSSNSSEDFSVASSVQGIPTDKEVTDMKTIHGNGEPVSEDTARIKPLMARLDALQIQQQMQGMNHPDVLFALKHLAQAHRRHGEFQQAQLVEEMLRDTHHTQEEHISSFY